LRNAIHKALRAASLLALIAAASCYAFAQQAAPAAKPTPSAPAPLDIRVKANETEVDGTIPDDKNVTSILEPYAAKVRALDRPIAKVEGELSKQGMGGGAIGNFVADAIRERAQAKFGKPIVFAMTNTSGFRKDKIADGNLSERDIFELLPFENALTLVDVSGEQLRRILDLVVSHRDSQSGARILYRTNEEKKLEIVTAELGSSRNDVQPLDPKATYTIVTIDYLIKRGGEYAVLQEAKNLRPLNLTIRDAVIEYVKSETAANRSIKPRLDGRFRQDRNPR
jgi:2',3'-cyclic-nucleotide 2'-phosphodiesterase (5'-nucleotidase family)